MPPRARHAHSYEASWPIRAGVGVQRNYSRPGGVVYLHEGNGGVPGVVGTNSLADCKFPCRITGTGGAYGRFIATAGALAYEHVENPTGRVTDSWTISK